MEDHKTTEWWEENISSNKKGVIILHRDMYNSAAFLELSKKPSHVVVLMAALNQVYYERKSQTSNRQVLSNGGILYLPQNMLKVRGVKSNKTIAEAKNRLVELGFLDVLEYGTLHKASKFLISNRWRKYPNGDYHSKEQSPPGKSLYSEHGLKNPDHPVNRARRAKKMSVQKMNEAPIQEMNETELQPIQKMNEESPQIFQ